MRKGGKMSEVTKEEKEIIISSLNGNVSNIEKCEFRKSSKGNIVCHDPVLGDLFIVRKDGVVQGIGLYGMPRIRIAMPVTKTAPLSEKKSGKRLKAADVASQVQGELRAYGLTRKSRFASDIVVSADKGNPYLLKIKLKTDSRYINSFDEIGMEIEKDWGFGDVIHNAEKAAEKKSYDIYVSQYFRQEVKEKLEEAYYGRKDLYVPEGLCSYLNKPCFFHWANQREQHAMPNKAKLVDDKVISFEFCGEKVRFDILSGDVKVSSETRMLRKAAFARRNRKKIECCIRQVSKNPQGSLVITENGIKVSLDVLGRTVKIEQKESELSARKIERIVKEEKQDIEKQRVAQIEARKKKAQSDSLYGDITAMAVVACVVQNQKYITKNMVVHDLRGLKEVTRAGIAESFGTGRFLYVNNDYISLRADQLVRSGILKKSVVRGSYGKFEVLKPGEAAEYFLDYKPLLKKKSFHEFTDCDWISYMERPQKKMTKKAEREQMELLEKSAVFCIRPELFASFVSGKPEYWMEYIETMRSVESGNTKKYWRDLKKTVLNFTAEIPGLGLGEH